MLRFSCMTRRAPSAACICRRLPSNRRFQSTHVKAGTTTWGFVGLGQMGYPMARNLRAKIPPSDTLIIHDANPKAAKDLARDVGIAMTAAGTPGQEATIKIAETPKQLATMSENIITVLPETSHVESVISSMLEEPLPPTASGLERLFIDCSTIAPQSSRGLARAVERAKQGTFVDAPMSGGVVGATAATLTFMLGAPPHILPRVVPILQMLGRSVHHCGGQGAGLVAKLANNYLLALMNIATAEAMNLGIRSGLEPKVLSGLINASTGRNWCTEINNPVPGVVSESPASRGYSKGFSVGLMKKDLKLAIAAAEEADAKLVLHEKARAVYEALDDDQHYKGRDFSIVYQYLGEQSRTT